MTVRKPFFVVPLAFSAINATSEIAGHPASNLGRTDSLGLTWQGSGGGAVTVNFPAVSQVDFCSVLSANAKSTTTVRVQCGSFDSGVDPFIDPAITRSDGLYHSFTEFPSVQSSNSAVVTVAHTGTFDGSILVLGKKIEPARFYDYDYEMGVDDLAEANFTRHSVLDISPGAKLRTIDFTLGWLTATEYETSFRPMQESLGQSGMVYCCFDPEANAYRQARTYFGLFKKSPVAKASRIPTRRTSQFVIQSVI